MDKKIIQKYLEEIEENLKLLKEFRSFSIKELQDKKKAWMVEHGLQVTIQNMIDVSTHILASLAVNEIETYKDVMLWLGKKKIVPEKFAQRLVKMAGLRNILVPEYLTVEIKRVWNILRKNLMDFEKFSKYVYRFIE